MGVFLGGIVCIVMGFELMRVGNTSENSYEAWPPGTAPFGFLLLFVGAIMSLIAFGYLATPLQPWRVAADEYGDVRSLPSVPGVDRGEVAQQARITFILLLVAGLLLLEALPMYHLATESKLFVRDNCSQNCAALTRAELAFLFDLIPIAIADAFVVIMLFVYIQP